jgi:hypothetical protein
MGKKNCQVRTFGTFPMLSSQNHTAPVDSLAQDSKRWEGILLVLADAAWTDPDPRSADFAHQTRILVSWSAWSDARRAESVGRHGAANSSRSWTELPSPSKTPTSRHLRR